MGWRGHYAVVRHEDKRGTIALLVILAIIVLVALWVTAAFAWDSVTTSQHGRAWNAVVFSAANAAVSVTITPQASERVRVHGFSAFCSGGSASASITNGGSFSRGWVSSPTLFGTASGGVAFTPVAFTGDLGAVVVITLSTCGGGNTGTLTTWADTYAP